ncbi:MAG: NADH-ubiquinone/plastoquinone oxidoreductase chain 3 [Acidimicrobiia bacterium]|nr:NADH-ubiquinone/plastoquinone oxidoreductase chain 3 [Acidimicrobiia bacterium]
MGQYLPIFAMLVLAIVFAVVSRVVSKLMAPNRPSAAKSAPYECGIVPTDEPTDRFPVKFFLVAMIFIVFDVEVMFLFPFSIIFRELGGFGIAAIVIFTAAVFESFVFLIGNGALDWGPIKRLRASEIVSPSRTSTSTIRRVGLEGRPRSEAA